jgi:hypothetical protein
MRQRRHLQLTAPAAAGHGVGVHATATTLVITYNEDVTCANEVLTLPSRTDYTGVASGFTGTVSAAVFR